MVKLSRYMSMASIPFLPSLSNTMCLLTIRVVKDIVAVVYYSFYLVMLPIKTA